MLQSLSANVITKWSLEIDQDAVEVAQGWFPDIVQCGTFENTSAQQVLQDLLKLELPHDALLVPMAGPPCTDHSRTRGTMAPGTSGVQGIKLLLFAEFVAQLLTDSPWEVRFLNEHVIPQDGDKVVKVTLPDNQV